MVPTRTGFDISADTDPLSAATHRFEYDSVGTPPCMAVVSALAAAAEVEPTTLEPIAETVDTDALDALVRGFDTANGAIEVSWTQAGCDVTVSSDGVVTVSSPGGGHPGGPSVDE